MATLFDSASLALIPSGVKDGKVYSIKPTDGSGDFTFSRGTDTATRVNSSGLIEKERANLVLQSNTFSNASWAKGAVAVASGQSGYDGSSDAWSVTPNTSNASHYLEQIVSFSGVYTMSVYAKANGYNYILLWNGVAGKGQFFNLAAGTIASPYLGGGIDATMTSVGGEWYKCTFTFSASGTGSNSLFASNVDNAFIFAGNGTDGILIQDTQTEQGLVATDYIETTTAAVYEGITDNLPRLDYSGGASCPSLLLEPSRTNKVANSEYLASSAANQLTIAYNQTTSPEGVSNAVSLTPTTTASQRHYWKEVYTSVASDGRDTYSAFVKYNGYHAALSIAGSSTAWVACAFDLQNGTKGTIQTSGSFNGQDVSADIEDYGNGWYRIMITIDPYIHSTGFYYVISSATSANPTFGNEGVEVFTGNGTSGFYAYGLSIEEGSYRTSYIPTYGTSASRAADDCEVTSASALIGQTEGTLFVEAYLNPTSNFKHFYNVQDATNTESILIYLRSNNRVRFSWPSGSFDDALLTEAGWHKYAVSWNGSNISLFTDGAKVASFTNFNKTLVFNNLGVGSLTSSGDSLGGGVKQALSFTTALTDAEAIALTTI